MFKKIFMGISILALSLSCEVMSNGQRIVRQVTTTQEVHENVERIPEPTWYQRWGSRTKSAVSGTASSIWATVTNPWLQLPTLVGLKMLGYAGTQVPAAGAAPATPQLMSFGDAASKAWGDITSGVARGGAEAWRLLNNAISVLASGGVQVSRMISNLVDGIWSTARYLSSPAFMQQAAGGGVNLLGGLSIYSTYETWRGAHAPQPEGGVHQWLRKYAYDIRSSRIWMLIASLAATYAIMQGMAVQAPQALATGSDAKIAAIVKDAVTPIFSYIDSTHAALIASGFLTRNGSRIVDIWRRWWNSSHQDVRPMIQEARMRAGQVGQQVGLVLQPQIPAPQGAELFEREAPPAAPVPLAPPSAIKSALLRAIGWATAPLQAGPQARTVPTLLTALQVTFTELLEGIGTAYITYQAARWAKGKAAVPTAPAGARVKVRIAAGA